MPEQRCVSGSGGVLFGCFLALLRHSEGKDRACTPPPAPRAEVQDRCDYAVRMALDAADTVKGNGLTQEQLLGHLGWPWGGFGVGFPTALLTGRPMPKNTPFCFPPPPCCGTDPKSSRNIRLPNGSIDGRCCSCRRLIPLRMTDSD